MLLLLFFISYVISNQCQFTSGDLKFDLTKIPLLDFDLWGCGLDFHTLVLDLCENMEYSDCPSEDTHGPGNGCDVIGGESKFYYWVGNANNMTISPYDKESKQYDLYYFGTIQSYGGEGDIKVTMVCNEYQQDIKTKCFNSTIQHNKSIYNVEIVSNLACPL